MATAYDCKFIETSVGINHNVDELLVGLLTQIRLKLENPEKSRWESEKRIIDPIEFHFIRNFFFLLVYHTVIYSENVHIENLKDERVHHLVAHVCLVMRQVRIQTLQWDHVLTQTRHQLAL
jgi:hypothetical protein